MRGQQANSSLPAKQGSRKLKVFGHLIALKNVSWSMPGANSFNEAKSLISTQILLWLFKPFLVNLDPMPWEA